MPETALCLDVGSTFTKAALVALPSGALLGTAEHPTTSSTDVLEGIAAVRATLGVDGSAVTYACSSAGGGLRLVVVGYERAISAEAGQRVALSAGARVVYVAAGRLDTAGIAALAEAAPDLILLVGGTDGGEHTVLLHNAARLARSRLRAPVIVAGNADAREQAVLKFTERRRRVIGTDNVIPDIGQINPGPARAAIRQVFLAHVIGGKGLSRGRTFARLVRAVTPDTVLDGVALLGSVVREHDPGSRAVVVIDVGGATTDVYSALPPQTSHAAVESLWDRRTVEGDLGMRWSAPSLVTAAETEGLAAVGLAEAAARRAADVALLPESAADVAVDIRLAELAVDTRLAELAAIIALRRHVRAESAYEQGSVSAEGAALVVLSGGVFRHLNAAARRRVIDTVTADRGGARAVLDRARVVVDDDYVLAPAGLLRAGHPGAARALVTTLLRGPSAAAPSPG